MKQLGKLGINEEKSPQGLILMDKEVVGSAYVEEETPGSVCNRGKEAMGTVFGGLGHGEIRSWCKRRQPGQIMIDKQRKQ